MYEWYVFTYNRWAVLLQMEDDKSQCVFVSRRKFSYGLKGRGQTILFSFTFCLYTDE